MENLEIFGWIFDKKITPDIQLKQGDLLLFPNEKNELRKYGIVITADCDIEHKKHGRLITLIPLVKVQNILENYLLIEDFDRKRNDIFNYCRKELNIIKEENEDNDDTKNIMAEKIRLKIETSNDEILKLAGKILFDSIDTIKIDEHRKITKKINKNLNYEVFLKKLEDKINNKGDIIILPSLKKISIDQNIAWIRNIWQISISDVYFKNSDAKEFKAQRIGRLDSPFRYRLTQLMGQVFSDIGLPSFETNITDQLQSVIKNDEM